MKKFQKISKNTNFANISSKMGRYHSGAKHVASSDKMIKVHRRNAVHAGTLRAQLDKLDVECRHKVNKISHEIFNIYFQEELPRERDILNRKLRKVPSLGSLMTLKSTGNEVFLYHTPRDRPMSRHPLLQRDAAHSFKSRIPEESELEDNKDGKLEEFRDDDIVISEQTMQDVSIKQDNTGKNRKKLDDTEGNISMLGRNPLPKFLPPMCRTYIDLLKSNNTDNKERQNITSKAHSEKLAKLSQVERGAKFIEKLKKKHPDRVKEIEEIQTKSKEPDDASVPDAGVNQSAKDETTETLTQQQKADLISVFLMRNKIINEDVGSDDDKSSSASPESQKDFAQSESISAHHAQISKTNLDLKRLFEPLVIPANRRKFGNHEPEYAAQRKFSVPGEESNKKQDTQKETIDFRQALTSLREEALSKSKEGKKKTKKRKGRKH